MHDLKLIKLISNTRQIKLSAIHQKPLHCQCCARISIFKKMKEYQKSLYCNGNLYKTSSLSDCMSFKYVLTISKQSINYNINTIRQFAMSEKI